jgi:hypothetical protein
MTLSINDQPPVCPLGHRLAWKLLGWGFGREDGFWIADAFLQDEPHCSKRDIWWKDGTLNVRMRRSRLEISVEPRHIGRMVWLMAVSAVFAAGWITGTARAG